MNSSEPVDFYRTLGLQRTASLAEIRRAYRILARRYHPDVNPGSQSSERFSAIANAYEVLSDENRRRAYDADLNATTQFSRAAQRAQAYAASQAMQDAMRGKRTPHREQVSPKSSATQSRKLKSNSIGIGSLWQSARKIYNQLLPTEQRSLAIVEVSLSIREAVLGGKKSVELQEDLRSGPRKISLTIPPATRNGGILQLRSKSNSKHQREEILIIFRVGHHPFITIENRGIVTELAISLSEAVHGATFIVPTFDEPVALKIPAFTSSGQEFRLKGKGVIRPDGSRGDLFFRTSIKLPESVASKEKLSSSIANPNKEAELRGYLPKSLNELR